jgi:hypothetical protein
MSILRGSYDKDKSNLIMPTKGVLDFTAVVKLDFKQEIKPKQLKMKDIIKKIFKAIKEN